MDDDMNDLDSGTQPDVEEPKPSAPKPQPGKGQNLKNVGKKGPKLSRARKKNPVTLSNKTTNKAAGLKKGM